MSERRRVARVDDIPPGKAKAVHFAGEEVAVFNINGSFYAISDTCPHNGAPLSGGILEGKHVVCPWHGWKFDLEDATHPPSDLVFHYKVHVVEGYIELEVPKE